MNITKATSHDFLDLKKLDQQLDQHRASIFKRRLLSFIKEQSHTNHLMNKTY
jgi:hypothetical protein